MQATIRIGDHVLVITENLMTDGDQTHEAVAYITAEPGKPAVRATLENEQQATLLVRDFLNEDLDENGLFAILFPGLAP